VTLPKRHRHPRHYDPPASAAWASNFTDPPPCPTEWFATLFDSFGACAVD